MPANRLGEQLLGGWLITRRRETQVDGLARCVDRTVSIAPRTVDLESGFVHAPTHPHRPLTPMKRVFEPRARLEHPSLKRGVIAFHPAFFHEVFDVACPQGRGHLPTNPHEMTSLGQWAPVKLTAMGSLPHDFRWITAGKPTLPYLT